MTRIARPSSYMVFGPLIVVAELVAAPNQTPGVPNQTPGAPNQTPAASNQTPGAPNQTPGAPNQTPAAPNQTPGQVKWLLLPHLPVSTGLEGADKY